MSKTKNIFKKYSKGPDYFHENRMDFKPIIDGFLYSTETLLLYGASGSAKSLFTLALAGAVDSSNGKFLGQKCAKDLSVYYLDGEQSTNSISDRFRRFAPEWDRKKSTYFASSTVANEAEDWVDINLGEQAQQDDLIQHVINKSFDVVVIDSVRTLFHIEDENAAHCWRPLSTLVMRLRQAGCAVIVVHHATKAVRHGEAVMYSGSSNIETVFDRTIGIKQERTGVWSLDISNGKQGRSGDGWGDFWNECAFKVGDTGLEVADIHEEEEQILLDWWAAHSKGEFGTPKASVQAANKVMHFGIGSNPTQQKLWDASQHIWELIRENGGNDSGLTIPTGDRHFKELFKNPERIPVLLDENGEVTF